MQDQNRPESLPSRRHRALEEKNMLTPQDTELIFTLKDKGHSERYIARTLKISRNTVRRYLKMGRWQPRAPAPRDTALDGLEDWLRQTFLTHHGNAAVVHQQLRKEHELEVSLRCVQKAVAPFRRELAVCQKATVRFETPAAKQLQADFGERRVLIAGQPQRVHFAVLTLGFSRRCFVQAFENEKQLNWLRALEGSFERFGGVPQQILVDNARALVKRHGEDEVEFNPTFKQFCDFWGVTPRACKPYRARTKGKVENGVHYVQRNALAGHTFETWDELHAHLNWWTDQVADLRIHGTTKEVPLERFEREEAGALTPFESGRAFGTLVEHERVVNNEACVNFATNSYSVPWRLISARVQVRVTTNHLRVFAQGECVAEHELVSGRHLRVIEPLHLEGMGQRPRPLLQEPAPDTEVSSSKLARPLSEYAEAIAQEAS